MLLWLLLVLYVLCDHRVVNSQIQCHIERLNWALICLLTGLIVSVCEFVYARVWSVSQQQLFWLCTTFVLHPEPITILYVVLLYCIEHSASKYEYRLKVRSVLNFDGIIQIS